MGEQCDWQENKGGVMLRGKKKLQEFNGHLRDASINVLKFIPIFFFQKKKRMRIK